MPILIVPVGPLLVLFCIGAMVDLTNRLPEPLRPVALGALTVIALWAVVSIAKHHFDAHPRHRH